LAVKSEERSRKKIAVLIGGFFIVFVFTPNAGVIIGPQGKKTKGSIWHFLISLPCVALCQERDHRTEVTEVTEVTEGINFLGGSPLKLAYRRKIKARC
jgi:hypothetical protein